MTTLPTGLDRAVAWEPWVPTATDPWDRRQAAHLYRRAAFGAAQETIDAAVAQSPQECVDALIQACQDGRPATAEFNKEMEEVAAGLPGGDPQKLESWWLYRMLHTPAPLQERMTLFWHGHFATSAAKVQNASLLLQQNCLLRQHALGHFSRLVGAVSRDPAMLIYLDSTTNARLHPNENYARELMELFCLGVGNYVERDIQEAARCFTGWEIRRRKFRFNRHQHDFGEKTLFGEVGDFDGDDAIRIILQQDAAPRFIARKLVRALVCDRPLANEVIDPLARQLRDSDFHIEPVVRRILQSRLFFSPASHGQKIRSPVDLAVGLLRCLDGAVGANEMAKALRPLGQRVFYPPNVKGWDGGRTWINATTFIGRVNLVRRILQHPTARFAGESLDAYCQKQLPDRDGATAESLVRGLGNLLLAGPLTKAARSELLGVARAHPGGPIRAASDVLCTLAATPEFQLA